MSNDGAQHDDRVVDNRLIIVKMDIERVQIYRPRYGRIVTPSLSEMF